ncbi:CDAN1 [Acanthosepion pharaonis]|uniref:CDAN1 n=1 Tax=Acanthosepion pharaonis TaxID=158019 RepID=A0A812BBQ5_ACAPH|nr:CDAN1 [Sepia pharaonis]
MANVLEFLFKGRCKPDHVVSWIQMETQQTDVPEVLLSFQSERREFIPFLLNYLRGQTSHLLQKSKSASPSPVKWKQKAKPQISTPNPTVRTLSSSLFPNLTVEIFFLIQLLVVRCTKEDIDETDCIGHDFLRSIHNVVYFSLKVLEKLLWLLPSLGPTVLKLLSDNPRVESFSPVLKQCLCKIQENKDSSTQLSPLLPRSSIGGVSFQAETDNRNNFPTPKSFSMFRAQRLQERFIIPLSTNGPSPPPSFTGSQEFFHDFILSANNHVFNQHISDLLKAKILELDKYQFVSLQSVNEDNGNASSDIKREFKSCLLTLRLLAKFLGFLTFLPYQSINSLPEEVHPAYLEIRNNSSPPCDILVYLKQASIKGRLCYTIPWVVEFLRIFIKEMNRELTKLSKPSKVISEVSLPSYHDTNSSSPSQVLIELKTILRQILLQECLPNIEKLKMLFDKANKMLSGRQKSSYHKCIWNHFL